MPEPGFVMFYLGWRVGWRGPRMTGSLPRQRYRDIISRRCTVLTLLGIDSYMIAGVRIDLLNTGLKDAIMAERLSDALIVMEVGSLCIVRSGLVWIGMVPKEGMPARDHNRRAWDPDITCTACKRRRHTATNCDMLAMALFLENYVKKNMSHVDRDKIKAAWLQQWKDRRGNPSCLPRKVMKAYLEYMDVSTEVLDNQMDWDCWPEDDDVEDFDFTVSADLPSVL
jgi:hypothetical protein